MKNLLFSAAFAVVSTVCSAQYSVDSNVIALVTPTNTHLDSYAGTIKMTGNDYKITVSPPGSPIYVWRVLFEPDGKDAKEAQFRQPNAGGTAQGTGNNVTYSKTAFNINDLSTTPKFLYSGAANTYLWATFPQGYFDDYKGKLTFSRSPQYRVGTKEPYEFPFIGQSNLIIFTIGNVLAVNEFNPKDELAFYPNPANETVILKSDKKQSVAIYDLSGKKLMEKNLEAGENKVEISGLAKGIYLLKTSDGYTSKLIKN